MLGKREADSALVLFLIVVCFSLQELLAFCSIEEGLGAAERRSSSDVSSGTYLAVALLAVGGLGWSR